MKRVYPTIPIFYGVKIKKTKFYSEGYRDIYYIGIGKMDITDSQRSNIDSLQEYIIYIEHYADYDVIGHDFLIDRIQTQLKKIFDYTGKTYTISEIKQLTNLKAGQIIYDYVNK